MSPLSSDELRAIREELSAGTTPTVWFTSSAVGVQEGRSGKVIALGEPAEGDFIQVRPAGSKDVLSFSTAEITQVKPPRKKPTPEPAAKSAAKGPAGKPSQDTAAKPPDKPVAKPAAAAKPPATTTKPGESDAARRKPRLKQPVGGAVVTLTADDNGQWSVEVANTKRKLVKPTQVPANAVAQAAKVLHDDVAAAVEPVIEAAREQHRARVEQLRAELEAAQAALEELDE
ncbi:DUF6319 family protein [Saccharopolyspora dendranthemae]|uniref:Cell wall anchor protein n=1 Tax=Saccharopolyspora dendranthemae TaxID=1181886 RepID=A0A561VC21_9PSEU|nr:DUF6319 family protein [Saccharopolyspora dendranthemae]TWG09170.1 hypothetical protein FHU35_111803 [Saccharopolyspora dendranthemae]